MANFHTGTTLSPESQPATTESPVHPRDILFLICWLLACGGLVFWRSFHVSYSFDDVAHLHALAAYRSGEISLTHFLLHNHNEHFLPLVRLYFMAATKISGLSSASMHVFLFLNYVAGAFACAWIGSLLPDRGWRLFWQERSLWVRPDSLDRCFGSLAMANFLSPALL